MEQSRPQAIPRLKGWLHLDLVRLLVLALPVVTAHTIVVTRVPVAARPAWMLVLALTLAGACLLLLRYLIRGGPRTLGSAYLAFVLAFVSFLALAAHMDLVAGPRRSLAGFQQLPPNVFGLGWLEDWHYCVAPEAPPAGDLLIVSFPSFQGLKRAEVRQRIAFLIRQARLNDALGVALDIYFEHPSPYDTLLRAEVEAAAQEGMPVVFGYRQLEVDGQLVRGVLPPELAPAARYLGHLQGYREADGQVRLIPVVLPKVGQYPALSVTVAGLLPRASELIDLAPMNRLLRFVKPGGELANPSGGVDVQPFARNLDWSILRDRFVLAGSGSPDDRVATPFGELQGVEVHSWSAHALATGSALTDVDPRYTPFMILVLCYVLTVLHARDASQRQMIVAALTLSAVIMAAAAVAARLRMWLEVSYPLLAVWLLTALLLAIAWHRRRKTRVEMPSASLEAPVPAMTGPAAAGPAGGTPEDDAFDVFLSHNSQDKPTVRELAAALRARGLAPWLDEEHLVPGRPWQEELEQVMSTVPAIAILVGAEGLGPWEKLEARGALEQAVLRGVPVIPVLLPCASNKPTLPLFLGQYTWVDFGAGLTAHGMDLLEWGITSRRPTTARAAEAEPA